MKLLTILASIVAATVAQRPTYAGLSSKGYPELASRFRGDDDDNIAINVGNRLGTDDDRVAVNLPTDARGDAILVNRLNQWPRENRPFWLINAEHLERHRHPNGNTNQQTFTVTDSNNVQTATQQRLNEIQPSFNQQRVQLDRSQNGQVQSRFGEPVGTEIRTIKPLSQRGSFAGERPF